MKNQRKLALAIILIGMGIYFLVSKYIYMDKGSTALIIGIMLGLSYFISGKNHLTRNKVYLTFGSIAASFGGACMVYQSNDIFNGYLFYLYITAISLALFIIHFVSEGRTEIRGKYVQSWALRLGILLLILEGIAYMTQIFSIREILFYTSNYWPIILIVIGVIILIKEALRIKKNSNSKGEN